jgi:hypothetical protein
MDGMSFGVDQLQKNVGTCLEYFYEVVIWFVNVSFLFVDYLDAREGYAFVSNREADDKLVVNLVRNESFSTNCKFSHAVLKKAYLAHRTVILLKLPTFGDYVLS